MKKYFYAITYILILTSCTKDVKQEHLDECCSQGAAATVLSGTTVIFPNVFTPNGDGVNDTLKIIGLDAFATNTLTIKNTSGTNVFHEIDYKNDWIGTGLDDGKYSYELTVSTGTLKGLICIIREANDACSKECVMSETALDNTIDC